MSKPSILYLFVSSVFLAIISPHVFSDGMFMDGLIYATISRNLSEGLGSFWNLFYTETTFHGFNEHPPLAIGLQSIFFYIFGDHILIERIYSLATFVITGWIIIKIWKQVTAKKFHQLGWVPLLFWILIPLITWSASNNMLENTMMIFVSLSVFFYLKYRQSHSNVYLILSGFMIFLAFLSKGPVGLFTLSFPFWVWVFDKKTIFYDFLKQSSFLLLGLLLPFVIIYFFVPEGMASLTRYFNKQVVGSLDHVVTVNNRFHIIIRLFSELIPNFIVMSIVIFLTRNEKFKSTRNKWAYIFIGLGLSGVIPIMISMKQSGFYMLTSFPFFALGLSLLMLHRIQTIWEKISDKTQSFNIFKYLTYLLFVGSLIFSISQINSINRNKKIIEDVYKLRSIIPPHTTISILQENKKNWKLYGYFYRYDYISLDAKNKFPFLLVNKGSKVNDKGYVKQNIELQKFDLYHKK